MNRQQRQTDRLKASALRVGAWAGKHAAAVLIGVGVTTAAVFGLSSLRSEAPTIPERIDQIAAQAERDGYYISTYRRDIALRRSGRGSVLMVLRPRLDTLPRVGADGEEDRLGESDEVRIYDRAGDSLELAFRFRPEVTRSLGLPVRFSYRRVVAAATGKRVLVGSFAEAFADSVLPIPVLITWDAANGSYEINGVGDRKVTYRPVSNPGIFARGKGSLYREQIALLDRPSGISTTGRRTEEFAVEPGDEVQSVVLVAAYTLRQNSNAAGPLLMAAEGWGVDLDSRPPGVYRCGLPGGTRFEPRLTGEAGALENQLAAVLDGAPAAAC